MPCEQRRQGDEFICRLNYTVRPLCPSRLRRAALYNGLRHAPVRGNLSTLGGVCSLVALSVSSENSDVQPTYLRDDSGAPGYVDLSCSRPSSEARRAGHDGGSWTTRCRDRPTRRIVALLSPILESRRQWGLPACRHAQRPVRLASRGGRGRRARVEFRCRCRALTAIGGSSRVLDGHCC